MVCIALFKLLSDEVIKLTSSAKAKIKFSELRFYSNFSKRVLIKISKQDWRYIVEHL